MNDDKDESEDDNTFFVFERTTVAYRWARRGFEEAFAETEENAGFAKWLANPSGGRFLVVDFLEVVNLDARFINAETQQELIEVLNEKITSEKREQREKRRLCVFVSSEIESAIKEYFCD